MDNNHRQPDASEWQRLLGSMLGAAVLAGINTFVEWTQQFQPEQQRDPHPGQSEKKSSHHDQAAHPHLFVVSELMEAAALLGVQLDSSADEIRHAMRFKMMATGAHPDHGGEGEEAQRLIAARDLLINYAKVRAINAHAGGAP